MSRKAERISTKAVARAATAGMKKLQPKAPYDREQAESLLSFVIGQMLASRSDQDGQLVDAVSNNKQTKNHLKKVRKGLQTFAQSMVDLPPATQDWLGEYAVIGNDERKPGLVNSKIPEGRIFLSELAERVLQLRNTVEICLEQVEVPKQGRHKKVWHDALVYELACVFAEITGTKATHSVVGGVNKGPFFDFAEAVWRELEVCEDASLPERMKNLSKVRDQFRGTSIWVASWKLTRASSVSIGSSKSP
jgi:hypothetical protein